MSELILVIAQKIVLIQENPKLSKIMSEENTRLRGNLDLLRENRKYLIEAKQQLLDQKATDLEPWESMKSTFNSWLNNVKSDITKEKITYDELKDSVKAASQ